MLGEEGWGRRKGCTTKGLKGTGRLTTDQTYSGLLHIPQTYLQFVFGVVCRFVTICLWHCCPLVIKKVTLQSPTIIVPLA